MTTPIKLPASLDELLSHLQTHGRNVSDQRWTALPTYGGGEPRDTCGVWSWDDHRLLVGTCATDLKIVDRDGR